MVSCPVASCWAGPKKRKRARLPRFLLGADRARIASYPVAAYAIAAPLLPGRISVAPFNREWSSAVPSASLSPPTLSLPKEDPSDVRAAPPPDGGGGGVVPWPVL